MRDPDSCSMDLIRGGVQTRCRATICVPPGELGHDEETQNDTHLTGESSPGASNQADKPVSRLDSHSAGLEANSKAD